MQTEDNERLLAALKEAGLGTQLWVGFAPGFFEGVSDQEKVARGAEMVRHLSDRAAETKSRVALYNHGDWFGEPENQVRIIRASLSPYFRDRVLFEARDLYVAA